MSSSKKNRVRALLVNVVLVSIAFGLLGYTVYKNRDQIQSVLSRRIDFRLFAVAFAIYMSAIVLTFYRWYRLVRVIEPKFTLASSTLLGFIGNVFNLVIPGAVGGDFIKAAYLVRMDINRTQAVASMVIDRILGLLGLFILAGVAGAIAWPMADREVRLLIAIVWCAVACGLIVLALIFNQSLTRRFPSLKEGHGKVAGILRELSVMSETYRGRLDLVASCLIGSSCIHSLFVVTFYIVSRAIFPTGVPSLAQHMLVVPLTLFTTAVPIPFGALGLSEQVGDRLGALVNHPSGAIAMMGFRLLMYAGGLVSAAVYLANLEQVRSLTQTAEELRDELEEGGLDGAEPVAP